MSKKSLRITPNESLAVRSAKVLREFIHENYPEGGKIPGEIELAELLNVNRATVRQALSMLEQEGVVIRVQGSGTYANSHVLRVSMRLETHFEYSELIKSAGYTPRIQLLGVSTELATKKLAHQLELGANTLLVAVNKLFFMDDTPAIHVTDMIPATLLNKPIEEIDFECPIFDLLEEHCRCRLTYGMSAIAAHKCEDWLAERLGLEPDDAVVCLNSTYYREPNEPVMYARAFFNGYEISLHVLRRRL